MSRYYSYINSARQVLSAYHGDQPFAVFLKNWFRQFKKFGAADRRQITALCYGYFRMGKAALTVTEQTLLKGLFLTTDKPNALLEAIAPQFNKMIGNSLAEKLRIADVHNHVEEIFPWKEDLSAGIDHAALSASHLVQPDLFLRLRPGKEQQVIDKLGKEKIPFTIVHAQCLALPNATRLDDIIQQDREAVIQDLNSQQVGDLLTMAITKLPVINAWDCCAASGGKSLLLYDLCPTLQLTVSDIRESILHNLKKRFERAGIKQYRSFVADLTGPMVEMPGTVFNLVICDAPCSGSGTWGRTPEQLYYFQPEKIMHYVLLQQKIILNALKKLKPGGYFLYITCSVFKKENEEQVAFILQQTNLQLVAQNLYKGYEQKADTLFAALFQANI